MAADDAERDRDARSRGHARGRDGCILHDFEEPQRDAVGWGLKLISSDWRTNSAKTRAKLPSIRKTMIRRVTGNRLASTG